MYTCKSHAGPMRPQSKTLFCGLISLVQLMRLNDRRRVAPSVMARAILGSRR